MSDDLDTRELVSRAGAARRVDPYRATRDHVAHAEPGRWTLNMLVKQLELEYPGEGDMGRVVRACIASGCFEWRRDGTRKQKRRRLFLGTGDYERARSHARVRAGARAPAAEASQKPSRSRVIRL